MCRGTSHRPDEIVTYQSDRGQRMFEEVKKGDVVHFQPMKWAATVEQVAVNAVMAGCKPEYFPVVLAIAESGCADRHHRLQQPVVRGQRPHCKRDRHERRRGHARSGQPGQLDHRPCLPADGHQPGRAQCPASTA